MKVENYYISRTHDADEARELVEQNKERLRRIARKISKNCDPTYKEAVMHQAHCQIEDKSDKISNLDIDNAAIVQAGAEIRAEESDKEYYDECHIYAGESTEVAETVDYTVIEKDGKHYDPILLDHDAKVISDDKTYTVSIGSNCRCTCTESSFGDTGYCTHIAAAEEVLEPDFKFERVVESKFGRKVTVDFDYELKDEFKETLEWDITHRTWSDTQNRWTVDADSIEYVQDQLSEYEVEISQKVKNELE